MEFNFHFLGEAAIFMPRRININDSIQEPFYQLPKLMIWDKKLAMD